MTAPEPTLRELAAAATPGPWEARRVFWKIGSTRGLADDWWATVEAAGDVIATMPEEARPSIPNAAFIAAANPAAVTALLDRAEAAEAKVARVESACPYCAGTGVVAGIGIGTAPGLPRRCDGCSWVRAALRDQP